MPNPIEMRLATTSLPPRSVIWGVGEYERYFAKTGVNSGEFTVRNDAFFAQVAMMSLARSWGYRSEAMQRIVASGHQSFREETALEIGRQCTREVAEGPRTLALARKLGKRAAMTALFPERMASLWPLASLQRVVGRIPAVVYPEVGNGSVVYARHEFSASMAQPTARWLGVRGLPAHASAQEVMAQLRAQGIQYACPDLFHAQRSYDMWPYAIADPSALFTGMAAMDAVWQVHLSLGRSDSAPPDSPLVRSTVASYRAFVRSAEAARRTPEGEMLLAIVDAHRVHTPFVALPVVLETNPLAVDTDSMDREYRAIVENTYELVG